MSEFIAEAQVLIQPNTAQFAATLKKQLEAAVLAAGPVVVPITAAPVATAETAAATAAIKANTAAQQEQGAVTQSNVVAQTNLARAEKLQAQAQALLTGATEVAALKTTELARTRSVLATTSRAVAVSEKAVSAAVASGNAALEGSTAALLANARAQEVDARAAVKNAVAHQAEAAATAEGAAAHAQATRGLAAETLALGGLRGATLAASAPFLVGATAAIVFAKSIREASDATEEFNKTSVVFGQSAQQIQDFSETTASSLGISSTEALKAAGIFGNLFRTIKISEPVSAQMSEDLVRLAADLASFNNADPSRTLEALRSGLVGQARPLRVFGIFLSAARVQQQALIETGKKNISELTDAEKVQARFTLILRDSTLAQGDFERTSDRAANQSRILKAQLADLGEALGKVLLPALTNVVGLMNEYVGVARRAVKASENFASALGKLPGPAGAAGGRIEGLVTQATKLYFRFALLGPVIGAATLAEKAFGDGADDASKKVSGFHFALGGLQAEIAAMKAVQKSVDFTDITQQLNALEVTALRIETGLAPGGRAAEEADLQKQIALDKKAVAQAKSGTQARRDAINALKADQDDLASLIAQDASDAEDRAQRIKDAAARQKQAAEDAAQAQADATQAFIDSFAGKQQRLANRLSTAQISGTTKTQIALNKLLISSDKDEIEAIQARIRHLKLHGDALKIAKAAIQALNQEIFNTRNAILQLQAERKQALVDARQSHLEAQLAIAETTASTKDDAVAQKALIKFDQAQIRRILAIKRRRRLTQEEAAQLDAYRVDLAQRNAALKKTKETVEDTGKKFKELTFAFLQTQQGFAANLLGNLIPGFATGGLVGGSQAAAGPRGGDNLSLGIPAQGVAAGAAGSAALASGRDRGVRPVQVDTTNHLLRQILRSLQNLNGRASHPEARHQKSVAIAGMDTMAQ